MSSLYNDFNPHPTSPMSDLVSRFNQFRSTFMGNPEQQVKQLIQSGRMSQEQFNELAQTASELYKLIK